MQRTLDVYLHRRLVGQLIQNAHGQMIFRYTSGYLEAAGAIALSHSLPLRKQEFGRNECRGFFAGLLPEEGKRKTVAKNLGISAANDFAMLEQIGGECAGAVTFLPQGQALPQQECTYRQLTRGELAQLLKDLPRRPLMAGEDGVRLSLAGAQDKIAVHVASDQISLPLGSSPSTHILKPAIEHYEGIVFNEALCMRLAHRSACKQPRPKSGRWRASTTSSSSAMTAGRSGLKRARLGCLNVSIRRISARPWASCLRASTRMKAGRR